MAEFNADDIACEVYDHIGSACSDLGFDHGRMLERGETWIMDDDILKWYEKAKAEGCTDIQGALTDWLYNDVGTIMDLMGDRIHDLIAETEGYDYHSNYKDRFNAVLDVMSQRYHEAISIACAKMRKEV